MAQPAQWVLKNENTSTVILGATKRSQIEDNLGSLQCMAKLDARILEQIDDIMGNKPVAVKDWNPNPSLN